MTHTAAQIAAHLDGEVIGDGSISLSGFSAAAQARPGDLTFAEKNGHFAAADASAASAVLVSAHYASASGKTLIRVANARIAAARVLPLLYPPDTFEPGVHPTAIIAPTARVDATAHIGAYCQVGPGTVIGARTVLTGGNHIGPNCQIGDDVRLYPNVVVYARTQIGHRVAIHAGTVIGSDGYGYVFDQGQHRKMLQIGTVVIGDDVEIGANSAIDRAALGSTRIGAGTKIDNLVHVAHNVVFGQHCLIMGQCGFAGSTTFGNYCVIASQTGVTGHLTIGHQVTVGGKSGVTRDLEDGQTVLGYPAVPDKQAKRQWVALQQLPELLCRLRKLEKQVATLTPKSGEAVGVEP
ncbi:MAG: UDP-3-O-(3-hydroxymyristoyl)glucosamine N-acyltransferase [Gemmatimonadetes bacterium]|nr:UDP-3-O-(3-hydroxymyristoyl)glucosamine N-acyltransferase [Gemmatimonadota bacterium]